MLYLMLTQSKILNNCLEKSPLSRNYFNMSYKSVN